MIKSIIHFFEALLLFLTNLIYRFVKCIKFSITSKHEFERICEDQSDTYEKTFKIDQWLTKTNCDGIRDFWIKNFNIERERPEYPPGSVHKTIDKILVNYLPGKTAKNASEKTNSKLKQRHSKSKKSNQVYRAEHIHLESGDDILSRVLEQLTTDLIRTIKYTKGRPKLATSCEQVLKDILYRIISYRLTRMIAERIASIKYDSSLCSHSQMLIRLWNNMVEADIKRSSDNLKSSSAVTISSEFRRLIRDKTDIIPGGWSNIGFQGEDPGTDFRGMGLLGLEQLEYLSRKPKNLSIDLLKRSLNEQHEYPWAIVGINITYNLLGLFRDGSLMHLYYDDGESTFRNTKRNLRVIKTFNDLYVELFLRFDCFWHESKPENIFAFKSVMEKFVDVIKTDLCNRNFSFKFLY